MEGISKRKVEGWQHYKLWRIWHSITKTYFYAENDEIAKEYAEHLSQNWDTAFLMPVTKRGEYHWHIWSKLERKVA